MAKKVEQKNNKEVKINKEVKSNEEVKTNKEVKNNEGIEKKEKKTTGTNKIFIIVLVVGMAILLTIYFTKSHGLKNKNNINNSYLLTTNTINLELKDLNEVPQVFTEAPQEYFVLISYTNDEETHELEKDLKQVIDRYKLNDAFYYYDAKELKEDNDCIDVLNETFKTNKIKKIPTILYVKDGNVIEAVTRYDNNMMKVGDFQKLLDIYDF